MTSTTTVDRASTPQLRTRGTQLLRTYGVVGALLLICIIATAAFPNFATVSNFAAIATAACFLGLITIGQSFVLISGGIDLSVGSMLGLGTVVAALVAPHGWIFALLVPVLVGAGIGFVNGLLIGKAKMAPFIVTLAALLAVKGAAVALAPSSIVIDAGNFFSTIGNGSTFGISNLILVLVGAFLLGAVFLNRTSFGSRVFALGGNEDAARMMGVDTAWVKVGVYAMSGALAGLAGALLASRLSSGVATLGSGYELTSIAAAVIGGVLLTGGAGTLLGALCGVLIVGVIQNIINQVGTLNAYYQDLATGLFLVVAVILQGTLSRNRSS